MMSDYTVGKIQQLSGEPKGTLPEDVQLKVLANVQADEIAALREQVAALTAVNPLWENVVKELAEMYEYWSIGEPVGVGSLMQAYDDWLE